MHVSAAGTLHQRQHGEATLDQSLGFGVRVRCFEHQRKQTLTAPVEELLQTLAERRLGISRTHDLDVAAALGNAHRQLGAQAVHRSLGQVDDRHAQVVSEGGDAPVEIVDGDGDARHCGDHLFSSVVIRRRCRAPCTTSPGSIL